MALPAPFLHKLTDTNYNPVAQHNPHPEGVSMIHLMNDIGCTGETFSSWAEVYLWVEEQIGTRLSGRAKLNIKRGLHFKVGSRYYSCMVSEESLADVA